MLYWLLGCLFIVGQFGHQISAQNLLYSCYAWGDPHLQTWRAQSTPLTNDYKQDCYANGEFDLVNNPFVQYSVKTHGRLIIHASLKFFNPTTNEQICRLEAIDLLVLPLFAQECAQNGITWTTSGTLLKFTVTISYAVNGVNFTTAIQRLNSYFNVHVWQPQSWSSLSNGLCTQADPKCTKSLTLPTGFRSQSITYAQAYSVCQAYFNAYLNRSLQKRTLLLNNIADMILGDCIEDVMFTGDIQMAESGLSVLMMEELTTGAMTTVEVQQAIDSGIQEASTRMEQAALEAQTKVAQLFR